MLGQLYLLLAAVRFILSVAHVAREKITTNQRSVQKFLKNYSQVVNAGKTFILIWLSGNAGIRGNERDWQCVAYCGTCHAHCLQDRVCAVHPGHGVHMLKLY